MTFLKFLPNTRTCDKILWLGINQKTMKWDRMHITESLGELQPKHPEICDQAHRTPLELLQPPPMTAIFYIIYQPQ